MAAIDEERHLPMGTRFSGLPYCADAAASQPATRLSHTGNTPSTVIANFTPTESRERLGGRVGVPC